jgi:RNA polymerase sigma-32 factor
MVNTNSFAMIPINSLIGYKNFALSVPNLSQEEEKELSVDFKINNNLKSAQKLIMSQLKAVVKISNDYVHYGLPQEDLIQEGNIGLMKAVKNYDPWKNIRLYTYAIIWIKAEIQNYILNNWKLVKIATTKNFKKLFFNYSKLKNKFIEAGVEKKFLPKLIAKDLDVESYEVEEIQNYFSDNEESIHIDNEDGSFKSIEIEDHKTPEKLIQKSKDEEKLSNLIQKELNHLNDKEKLIIENKFFSEDKVTNKDLAKILNVSAERVRQLEAIALNKLKQSMLKNKIYSFNG